MSVVGTGSSADPWRPLCLDIISCDNATRISQGTYNHKKQTYIHIYNIYILKYICFSWSCVYPDPSDDEWEEESSSDESDVTPDGLGDAMSGLMSPLCLSAEVHGALISHSIPEKANNTTGKALT